MIAETLIVESRASGEVIDITHKVSGIIRKSKVKNGICMLFVMHTTAALTTCEVGEGTDDDFLEIAKKIIPQIRFRHAHDSMHAWSHMASSLIGASLSVPIKNNEIQLGAWQSVVLLELDGPRKRKVEITILGE